VDTNAKRGESFCYFDGLFCGRHVDQNCGAGQYAIAMGPGYGLIYSVAETKVIGVYYDSAIHHY
jgi:hypothetical protein